MSKKNCIVTGGTSGLGLELVKKFINNNFFVHIIARDEIKIKKLLGYFYENNLKSFKFYQANLAEKSEVGKAILQIKNLNEIDVLINNAGSLFLKKEVNSEGIEKTFAVNYLSHFFITLSLIDLVKKAKNSRIINISSTLHKFAKLNLDDINFSKNYNGWTAYCNSKLMNLLFNYKINRFYLNKINSYAINPGWIKTNFGNNNDSKIRFLLDFLRDKFASKPSNVANQIYNLCTYQEYLNYSGKYLLKNKVKKSSSLSYKRDLQDRLWEMSLKMVNTKKNEIK